MNKKELMEMLLETFHMNNEVNKISNSKMTYTYKQLYDKLDKLADILVLMGQIEFVKGEKSEIINRAKEAGVIL